MFDTILHSGYSLSQELISNQDSSFEKVFWAYVKESIKPLIIINGYAYSFREIGAKENYSRLNHRYISFIGTLTVKNITDIWRIGKVPNGIKDNATIINKAEYTRLKNLNRTECRMKGCWDRYRCFWYKSLELDGAWNEIPKDYTPGIEQCESFIDKTTI